jgi:hypothetical protein
MNYVADILRKQGLKAGNGKALSYSQHSLAMKKCCRQFALEKLQSGRAKYKVDDGYRYIWVKKRWFYLATVTDLYSRSIVG